MTNSQHEVIDRLFDEALRHPPGQREAFLQEQCPEPEVRKMVSEMVSDYDAAGDLFECLARSVVPTMLNEIRRNDAAVQNPPDPLDLVGTWVGRYAVEEYLGGGGMGVVYRARDGELDRHVALKFLPPFLATHPVAEQRFVREAKAVAALDHPNIATIHEIGQSDEGRRYIALAYYEGETLKAKLARQGALPVDEALAYVEQVVEALVAAHGAGIIHRDVKPANVMVTTGGEVKLLDFGLARAADQSRLTEANQQMGTPAYMSPEQIEGADVSEPTDLWAVGVLMYELLTGAHPFRAERRAALVHAIVNRAPEPLRQHRTDIPPSVERVVARCLQKDAVARYESATVLLEDLRRRRSDSRLGTDVSERDGNAPRVSRRTVGVMLALALVALGIAVAWALLSDGIFLRGLTTSDAQSTARLGPRSVAVLPFTVLAAGDSANYFSLGMAGEITTLLAQVDELSVIGQNSVMQYRETGKTYSQIGAELGVAHLLTGSVQRVGSQVRLNAQLIDVRTGEHEWAESYTRRMVNVLALQSQLARVVTRELSTTLSGPKFEAASARTVVPEAYALYLQAQRLRFQQTHETIAEAIRLLRESVIIDSTFAPAWALLSTCALLELREAVPDGLSADSLARAAAGTALRHDSTSAEAHVALGLVRELLDVDFPAAGPHFKRAIELNPGMVDAHREYGLYLMRMGEFALARRSLNKAARLNPAFPVVLFDQARNNLWDRRYERAKRQFKTVLTLRPDSMWAAMTQRLLWMTYLAQDSTEAARQLYPEARHANPKNWAYARIGAHVLTGRSDSARHMARKLLEEASNPYRRAFLRAQLDAPDAAVQQLRDVGYFKSVVWLSPRINPFLDPLRDEPVFQEELTKMGLDDASVERTIARLFPS